MNLDYSSTAQEMRNFAKAIFVPSKAKNFSIAIATVKFFNAARCKKSEAKIADLGWLNYMRSQQSSRDWRSKRNTLILVPTTTELIKYRTTTPFQGNRF